MVERLGYRIKYKVDDIELRHYGETFMATVEGLSEREAFQALFRYISGRNEQGREVPMTSPVISSGKKIPMTSPVLSAGNGMYFVLTSS